MANASTWIALRNPAFRSMWLGSVLSGVCASAHDTAATLSMHQVSNAPLFLSLMSTMAALPFFFFTLPAGTLADMVDRKWMMFAATAWLALSAGALAVCGWLGCINPYVLLAAVFLIGVGFSFYSPAWTSAQPELVPRDELPSVGTLGALQFNISSVVGPALGGFLLRFVHPNGVFALNSACFVLLLLPILWLPSQKADSKLPLENFPEAFTTAFRYVRYTPGIQTVLARNLLFSLFIAVLPALIPVVGLKELHFDGAKLGLVYASMGVGAVVSAMLVLPRARKHLHSNTITVLANILVATAFLLMALFKAPIPFLGTAGLAGLAWTMGASELFVASQQAMPGWARARMNAAVTVASQGAMALGGVVWGFAASQWGTTPTLFAAGVLQTASLLMVLRLSIDFASELDFKHAPVAGPSQKLVHVPSPHDGPVSIHTDFTVEQDREEEFKEALRAVRLIDLRNGAFSWRLHGSLDHPHTYRVEKMVPSWTEYQLAEKRRTVDEQKAIDKAWSLSAGGKPSGVQRFLTANRRLHIRDHPGENRRA